MEATTKQAVRAALVFIVGVAAVSVCVAESQFVTQRLPGGLLIDVPKSWQAPARAVESAVKTTVEASADLVGLGPSEPGYKTALVRVATLPNTFAVVRVNTVTPPTLSPEEAESLTSAEVKEAAEMFTQQTGQLMQKMGQQMIGRARVTVEKVNTLPALVIRYRRTGSKGPVTSEQLHVFRKGLTYIMDLSYRESEANIWKPVMERIRKSIKQS